jgi:hypothetical protein
MHCLSIGATCNKIRDKGGKWHQVEAYRAQTVGVKLTHSICPDHSVKYPQ